MTPFYETRDGMVRVFCARWEDVLAAGEFEPPKIALVAGDPPYGIKARTSGRGAGRSINGCKPLRNRAYAKIEGDDKPFDPAPILALDRPTILWGGNHFASRLSDSPSWLLWDKRDGSTPDDGADGEMAWTNLGGPLRIFRHIWKGTLRASECSTTHLHPTQKPEALMAWQFEQAVRRGKLHRGDTVLVPWGGSMPEIRPLLAIGCKIIACEVVEEHCQNAVAARLQAMPHTSNVPIGPLFG